MFDYVVKQLEARYGAGRVAKGGLKVYTTINLHDQQLAREALFSHEQGGAGNVNAALASVDASNGHILALAGTESYTQTKFFYPVQAQRQTGSAAKVFALMTLIKDYNGDPSSTYYISKPLAAGLVSARPDLVGPHGLVQLRRRRSASPRRRRSPTTRSSPSSWSISGWASSRPRRSPWAFPPRR